jgi:hypothetical protein
MLAAIEAIRGWRASDAPLRRHRITIGLIAAMPASTDEGGNQIA